jgi:tetratricopeptide (TPR) repeat protein
MRGPLRRRIAAICVLAFGVSLAPRAQQTSDLSSRLDRFERGDWSVAQGPALSPDDLQTLLRTLKTAAPGWIAADGAQQQRRRRLVVATYVLQILNTEEDPYLWLGGGTYGRYHQPLPAAALLEWAADFLKHDAPLLAERWWHLGAIALLERSKAVEELVLECDRARGRFPDEDRWVLARALARELPSWPQVRDGRMFSASGGSRLFGYEDAVARVSVKGEAELRIGYFELRSGRPNAALKDFEQVGNPTDPALRYWLGLFQGQALEQVSRETDAVAAYRRAFDAAPFAQSAALALAAALAADHRAPEAAALTERTLTIRPVPFDPWAIYTLPDIRFWPRATAELRSAVTTPQ